MRATTAYPTLERYAREDFNELIAQFEEKYQTDAQLLGIGITENPIYDDDNGIVTFTITGTFQVEDLTFDLSYECIDDPRDEEGYAFPELTVYDLHDRWMHRYYMSMNQKFDAQDYPTDTIKASVAILAAEDDDPFADMGFDEPTDGPDPDGGRLPIDDEEDLDDSIDDMADTLDEINESLKDFDEDDVDIETENNIVDHFVAECEKCHGVFITSVVLSDMAVEKISGTCPLCDEECDQYLKWIIKEVE